MDLRKEAEDRAQRLEQAAALEADKRGSFRMRQSLQHQRRQSLRQEMKVNEVDFSNNENETVKAAQLAEIDYKWNGSRAKSSGNFALPRWVPDEEIMYCHSCNSEFDYFNRKHHCRHCGMVYCDPCSKNRALLPHEYGYKDPVRVCNDCYNKVAPMQQYLSTNIANHQRVNNIDVASTNCNVRRFMNMPYSSTLGSEIRKAAYSTHNLFSQALYYVRDKAIPLRLLATAKGIAFITVVKGGFIFAPRLGTGLVVARLEDSEGGGWSAPTAIATVGLSWGAVIGLDVTDYVIILNTAEAVSAFSGMGQVTIGAGIEVAIGPLGRSGSADFHVSETGQMAPAFSYSHSRGLFAGLSLDGSLVMARSEVNHCFYGRPVTPAELLSGQVPAPRAAAPLYDALDAALSALPDVHHVARPTVDPARRASLSAARPTGQAGLNVSAGSAVGAGGTVDGGDDTEQTIRDIDELLNASGYGSNSGGSLAGSRHSMMSSTGGVGLASSQQAQHRRRTMAAGQGVQQAGWSSAVVLEDEVWGVNSGLLMDRGGEQPPAVPDQQVPPPVPPSGAWGRWVGDTGAGGREEEVAQGGPQRAGRARPRSLPETRSDAVAGDVRYTAAWQPQVQPQPQVQIYHQGPAALYSQPPPVPVQQPPGAVIAAVDRPGTGTRAQLSAEELLGDVPKPIPTGEGKPSGSTLIDEELECVTANVNALL